MVVADVAVVLVRAGGLTAAAPLAGRRAAAAVVRRALPAAAAGNRVDRRVGDGGDGVAPPPGVQPCKGHAVFRDTLLFLIGLNLI